MRERREGLILLPGDAGFEIVGRQARKGLKFKMISLEEIQNRLSQKIPGAEITVQDMTGTLDHFQVHVMWQGFRGMSLIEQHQTVNRALSDFLEDGRIHALAIKTFAVPANR